MTRSHGWAGSFFCDWGRQAFTDNIQCGFLDTDAFIEILLDKLDNASVSTVISEQLCTARCLEQSER
ncbi:MAG: hypothetical protein PF630_01835 [Gammaproteobacteria bacterium]|jgi:hypothetical protein|nr:hypothetical protein [Gammaproteobacteria bacterium]